MEKSEAEKKMEAQQKVFNIPVVVEILISFLAPGTVSHDGEQGNPVEEPLFQSLDQADIPDLS